jgi:hypothetical protein
LGMMSLSADFASSVCKFSFCFCWIRSNSRIWVVGKLRIPSLTSGADMGSVDSAKRENCFYYFSFF